MFQKMNAGGTLGREKSNVCKTRRMALKFPPSRLSLTDASDASYSRFGSTSSNGHG
jgi:hypothetical protein